jgi:hypothetical protein
MQMIETTEVNKTHLVVLALYLAGGESDLEEITVKAFELFPQQFCWKRYPQYPDKDVVRVHLSDAKKQKFGNLVEDRDLREEGGAERGRVKRYSLTHAGLNLASHMLAEHAPASFSATRNPLEYRRLVEPILKSAAFQQFRAGTPVEQIGRETFLIAFKLFPDASRLLINGRLARVSTAIEGNVLDASDLAALQQFLEDGRHAFNF